MEYLSVAVTLFLIMDPFGNIPVFLPILEKISPERLLDLLISALIAWLATFIVLFSLTFLIRFLTRRGLIAIELLMGMVLVALAVQLFLDGISSYFGR